MMRLTFLRQFAAAVRTLLVLTVVVGIVYPLAVTGVGQVLFPAQANGSLARVNGRPVGSRLIGQDFSGPQWFRARPSAAGARGYDAMASGASNLGPTNPELAALIARRRAQIAREDGVPPSAVPPDALTASASGLDPDISPQYAAIQVNRVAKARGLDPATVRELVRTQTEGRSAGVLGEPRVNVLELNIALERLGR